MIKDKRTRIRGNYEIPDRIGNVDDPIVQELRKDLLQKYRFSWEKALGDYLQRNRTFKRLDLVKGTVVDMYCENGYTTYVLASMFPYVEKIIGIDPNIGAIRTARTLYGRNELVKIEFSTKSLSEVAQEDDNIQVISIIGGLYRIEDLVQTFTEINSALQTEGQFYFRDLSRAIFSNQPTKGPLRRFYNYRKTHTNEQSLQYVQDQLEKIIEEEKRTAFRKGRTLREARQVWHEVLPKIEGKILICKYGLVQAIRYCGAYTLQEIRQALEKTKFRITTSEQKYSGEYEATHQAVLEGIACKK